MEDEARASADEDQKPEGVGVGSAQTPADGMMVSELATMPAGTILDEARLARMLGVTNRTIRRMVQRNELPPAVRLAGRACWLAGKVLAHIEATADRKAKEAERHAARIRAMTS